MVFSRLGGSIAGLLGTLVLECGPSAFAVWADEGVAEDHHATRFIVEHLGFDEAGRGMGFAESGPHQVSSLTYGRTVEDAVICSGRGAQQLRMRIASDAGDVRSPAHGQCPARPPRSDFHIDRWTTENGLPANKVRSLHQSRDGYLWVGTVGGLARFDGVRFTVFNEENTPEMARNGSIVRAIFEDDAGRLWFGTKRGMLLWDGDSFVPFAGQDRLNGKMINGMARRSAGGFWIAHDEGVSWKDSDGVHDLNIEGIQRPLAVCEQRSRTLWIGGENWVFRYDMVDGRLARPWWRNLHLDAAGKGFPHIAIRHLYLDRWDRLWIGSAWAVFRLDPAERDIRTQTVGFQEGNWVPNDSRFAQDTAGRVWATTQMLGGIVMFPNDGSAAEWIQTPKVRNALCVLADREGAVWVGTHEGLVRLRQRLFSSMRLEGIQNFQGPVRALTEAPDGSLHFVARRFAGSWAGETIRVLDVHPFMPGSKALPSAIATFAGRAWIPHPEAGLSAFPDFQSGAVTNLTTQAVHPEIGLVRTMETGPSGRLWIAAENGLFQMTEPTRVIRVELPLELKINVLLDDRRGGLWIGGVTGLFAWNEGALERITPEFKGSVGEVLSLYQDQDDNLWIGTATGLNLLRRGGVHRFDFSSGLPEGPIEGIVEDDFGRLWLNHDAGVARVARAELQAWAVYSNQVPAVMNFTVADGLSSLGTRGSPQGCLKTRDGRLWFAKGNGLTVVDPALCPPGVPAPKVQIEKVLLNGSPLPLGAPLRLSRGEGFELRFQFAAPNLHSPNKCMVQYRLDGHDTDWRDPGPLRGASYSALPAGEYRFRVRARNHEGRWGENQAALAFEVTPQFFETTTGVAAGIVVVALGSSGLAAWLIAARHRVRSERQAALERERERLARNLHDHFAPRLAQIALAGHLEEAAQAAAAMSSGELRELIWEVHPENDSLSSLFEFFADFASRHLRAAGISLQLDLPLEYFSQPVRNEVRREISALFKESLQNVVRHAAATQVVVAVRWKDHQLHVCVQDNGRGFDPEQVLRVPRSPSRGYGLRNFQARCREAGGQCAIDSAPGQGTTVAFVIPLS